MTMYFARLLALLVFAGVSISSDAQAPSASASKSDIPKQEQLKESGTVVKPLDALPQEPRIAQQERTAQASPHEKADLEAQVRMAKASEDLVSLTKQQVRNGIIEAIALSVTILLTAWAARSASKAARAAIEAIHTERAWVIGGAIDQHIIKNIALEGVQYPDGLGFSVAWNNCGRTPALKVDCHTQGRTIPRDAPVPEFVSEEPPLPRQLVVGPSQGVQSKTHYFVGADYDAFMAQTHVFIFYSRVRYRDIFSNSVRTSDFTSRIEFVGYRAGPRGEREPYFEMSACGEQNAVT